MRDATSGPCKIVWLVSGSLLEIDAPSPFRNVVEREKRNISPFGSVVEASLQPPICEFVFPDATQPFTGPRNLFTKGISAKKLLEVFSSFLGMSQKVRCGATFIARSSVTSERVLISKSSIRSASSLC